MKQATTARNRAMQRGQSLLHCKWEGCSFIVDQQHQLRHGNNFNPHHAGKVLLDHWRKDHGLYYRATTTNPNITVECHWGTCSKRFRPGSYSTEAHIRGHLARELGWKEFACELCHVHFTRRPDLTAHFKKKHPHARPLNVSSSLTSPDVSEEMENGVATAAMLPPTPPSLMSPLIGSPTLIPTILSPTLSGVHDATPFQGLTSFETSLNMSSASPHHHSGQHHHHASIGVVDLSDIPVHDHSTFMLNSLPPVPDMYSALDTNMLLGVSSTTDPHTLLTNELLSGIHTPHSSAKGSCSPVSLGQQLPLISQQHQHQQQQQLQQPLSPLSPTIPAYSLAATPYSYSQYHHDVNDIWSDHNNDLLNSKAMLGSLAADHMTPEIPLLFGITDQGLDSSTWQVASLTAAHNMVHYSHNHP